MAAPQNDSQPVWQTYVDLNNDAKPFLQWTAGASPQDQLLQNTIDAACWWVQDFYGKPIAPTQFFHRFNGYTGFGGTMIDLPYYPVLADPPYSISVTEYWGVSGPRVLTQQTPENQNSEYMFTLDNRYGILYRSYSGLLQQPFFPGLKNVEVTWWAGYTPIPPHWRLGTLRLIKHWWDHDMQAQLGGFRPGEAGSIPHEFFPLVTDDIQMMFASASQVGIA